MVKGVLATIQRFWQFVTPVRSIPAKGLEINSVTKSSVQFLPTEHPVLYCLRFCEFVWSYRPGHLARLAFVMPPLYHKYRHLSRGILIKIRKNNQIVKDRCQDFQERAASRQAAVLSASLPHYTLYRLFVKPSCTIIRNYLEVFPIVVSRCQ